MYSVFSHDTYYTTKQKIQTTNLIQLHLILCLYSCIVRICNFLSTEHYVRNFYQIRPIKSIKLYFQNMHFLKIPNKN